MSNLTFDTQIYESELLKLEKEVFLFGSKFLNQVFSIFILGASERARLKGLLRRATAKAQWRIDFDFFDAYGVARFSRGSFGMVEFSEKSYRYTVQICETP